MTTNYLFYKGLGALIGLTIGMACLAYQAATDKTFRMGVREIVAVAVRLVTTY